MESTSRLWSSEHISPPEAPVLFVAGDGRSTFSPFVLDFFKLVEMERPVQLVKATTQVTTLYVPSQSLGLGPLTDASLLFKEWVRSKVTAPPILKGKKLFSSRARFTGQGKIVNEDELEKRLGKLDFESFHPEQHPLKDQLAAYQRAETIVFSEGSAIHLPGFY